MSAKFSTTRIVACVVALHLVAGLGGSKAYGQMVDLEGLGINADFEDPEVAHSNTAEATTTGNIGPGWTLEVLSGAVSNYGVQDPIGEGAGAFYCCFSGPAPGGTLPAPFGGRQIGFFNLNDNDSMGQIVSIPVGSLLAGQTYTLTVAIGARASDAQANIGYAIGLRTAGGMELGAVATALMNPAVATPTNIQDLTYTLTPAQTTGFIGQNASIFIRGVNAGNGPSPPDLAQPNFDNVRLSGTFGAVVAPEAAKITINRATGEIVLTKTGAGNFQITGYTLSSDTAGSFNSAAWTNIANNYDQSSGGEVDLNNNWTILSTVGSKTDLSEAELSGGDGGVLTPAGISLGNAWRRTHLQDVAAKVLLLGGTELTATVEYTGNAIAVGDFNADGFINGTDWTTFKNNHVTNMAALSQAEAYALGDMNGDKVHDIRDFSAFRAAYDGANGAGAFAAMINGVPEPTGLVLMALGLAGAAPVWRRRLKTSGKTRLACRLAAMATVILAGFSGQRAIAQEIVAHWSFDTPTITLGDRGIATATDQTGEHNATGVFGGAGPTIDSVAGKFGQAAKFTNTNANGQAQATNNAWMSFPQITEIAGPTAGDFTAAAWVNVPDQASWDSNTFLADWGNAAANTHRFTYWFSLANVNVSGTNDGLRPRAQIRAANAPPDPATIDIIATTLSAAQAGTAGGPTNFDDATWRHVVYTWTKSTGEMRFYTEGVLRHTQTTTQTNKDLLISDSPIGALGAKRDNNRYFVGSMDEVWVFNAALNQEQITNLFLFNDPGGAGLQLVIDKDNGQMQILNDANVINPAPLGISSYEITSVSGGLDAAGWSKLASGGVAGFPPGNGSGNGWEAGPSSNSNELTEWNLTGSSSVGVGQAVSLGSGYNEAMDAADIIFKYTKENGDVVTGKVVFETITPGFNPADFDHDNDVDGADFLTWRRAFGEAGATSTTGDTDNDGDADGADFLSWQRNFGATGAVAAGAAVPEPATFGLLALFVLGLAAMRWNQNRPQAAVALSTRAGFAFLALAAIMARQAAATVTNDREYRMGDDAAEGASALAGVGSGNTFGTTFDSQGPSFQDLLPAGGPTYVTVSDRPGATFGSLGIQLDGSDDYLQGLRFNHPSQAPGTIYAFNVAPVNNPVGPTNYAGLYNRGFQLWAKPGGAGGVAQNVVMDTNQHGVRINASNNWELRYNNVDVASTKAVSFGAWAHLMVVRTGGIGAAGREILYVNGEAVAARTGGYDTTQEQRLVVGSNTDGTLGTNSFFNGIVDQLTIFTFGKTFDNVDRGAFNYETDNAFAAQPFAQSGLRHVPGDVNQDGVVNQTDVNDMAAHWKQPYLVSGVPVGDKNSIKQGDLNFDGVTNLADVVLLRDALGPAATASIDFSGIAAPEPSSFGLAALSFAAMGFGLKRHAMRG